MKNVAIVLMLALFISASFGAEESSTDIEKFTGVRGAVFVNTYHEVGVIKGKHNTTMTVRAAHILNVGTGDVEYGPCAPAPGPWAQRR